MPQLLQDPIAGYWVAISEERSHRPLDFLRAPTLSKTGGECPFCPGNEHLTPPEVLRFPQVNSARWSLRVIPNKYPALTPDEGGVHEVIVDSPAHKSTFGELSESAAQELLTACRDRMQTLRQVSSIRYVQVFKNNGPGSGASLEHPHTQLLGLPFVPPQIEVELRGASAYYQSHRNCAFCELLHPARALHTVLETEYAVALAPVAPRFGFETWILPRSHLPVFEDSDPDTLCGAGIALVRTCRAIENRRPGSPYNVLIHTAPRLHPQAGRYHWHIEILPRISGIGGYEFGTGCYINTIGPREAAAALRGPFTP